MPAAVRRARRLDSIGISDTKDVRLPQDRAVRERLPANRTAPQQRRPGERTRGDQDGSEYPQPITLATECCFFTPAGAWGYNGQEVDDGKILHGIHEGGTRVGASAPAGDAGALSGVRA